MPKHPASQDIQTVITDASNSLEKAENAVKQAMSHTDETTLNQAEHALDRANRAVDATQASENQIAVDHLNARYEQATEHLANTQTEKGPV